MISWYKRSRALPDIGGGRGPFNHSSLVLFLSSTGLRHIEPANFPPSPREGRRGRTNLASESEPRFPALSFRLDMRALPKQIRQCEGQNILPFRARLVLVAERRANKL